MLSLGPNCPLVASDDNPMPEEGSLYPDLALLTKEPGEGGFDTRRRPGQVGIEPKPKKAKISRPIDARQGGDAHHSA